MPTRPTTTAPGTQPPEARQAHHGGREVRPDGTPHPAVALTLPYPPSSNRYWRRHGHVMHLTHEAVQYRKAVALLARTQGAAPLPGPVRMTLRLFRPRRAGDLMNREKQLSDALEGIAFENDSQIHEAHLFLHDDRANPRVEVLVEALR